jgi:hypothetical protein
MQRFTVMADLMVEFDDDAYRVQHGEPPPDISGLVSTLTKQAVVTFPDASHDVGLVDVGIAPFLSVHYIGVHELPQRTE